MSSPIKTRFQKQYSASLHPKATPKAGMGKVVLKPTPKWGPGKIAASQPHPLVDSLLRPWKLNVARNGQEPPETIEGTVSEPFLEPMPKRGCYIAGCGQPSSFDSQLPADRPQSTESSSIGCVDEIDSSDSLSL
jgi:hypothetical protein